MEARDYYALFFVQIWVAIEHGAHNWLIVWLRSLVAGGWWTMVAIGAYQLFLCLILLDRVRCGLEGQICRFLVGLGKLRLLD